MIFRNFASVQLFLLLILSAIGLTQAEVLSSDYGPPAVANEWERFAIPLTPEAFNVDSSLFAAVLANVTTFRIRTEMHTGNDIGSLDQVRIGGLHSSSFESGTGGWNAAGDGTMQWQASGGVPGGYIQISDWASGDWHYAVAPLSWSGDWRSAINDSITFYFKTDFPEYGAVIEISSALEKRLVLAANNLTMPKGGSTTMSVTLSEASPSAVTINLSSSSACIVVPEAVIVPANQTYAEFSATVPADAEAGCSSVITATATDYGTSRITLGVKDETVSYATLTGRVTDATTGVGIVGATVSVAGVSTTTDANGDYTLENIPTDAISANFKGEPRSGQAPLTVRFTDLSGNTFQSLTVTADNYFEYESQISLDAGTTTTVNVSLSPIITDNVLRIVLNWGDLPRDLDIHLLVPPETEGALPYQVYYSSKGRVDQYPYALLDIDKRQGYGPETITLKQFVPGRYICWVHNYSREAQLTTSDAVVQIYGKTGLLQTVNVPGSGEGEYWSVCEIDGETGQVTVINTLSTEQPRTSALTKTAAKEDVSNDAAIESWEWDFNSDGTVDATEQNPVHVYSQAGSYTVTLKVSDGVTTYTATKENYITVASSSTDPTDYAVTITGFDVSNFPLVKCYVSVLDNLTKSTVNGLTVDNFSVQEDGEDVQNLALSRIDASSDARTDIVFVFDKTGSMGEEIESLKNRILAFADSLSSRGIDYRLGLTTFDDKVVAIHDFTADVNEFKTWIEGLTAQGGGDTKENALEGLAAAMRLSFRENSQRIAVLITDADYHESGEDGDGTTSYTTESMISALNSAGIVTNVVGPDLVQHQRIAAETGGRYYNVFGNFNDVIDRIIKQIISQYVVTFTSPIPVADNTWRDVRILITRETSGGVGIGSYHIGTTRLLMNPPIIMGRQDDTFTLDIRVASVSDLAMAHFFVAFDNTKLEALNVWEGDFLGQGDNVSSVFVREIKNSDGLIEISASRLSSGGDPGISGSGLLARVEFRIHTDDCTSDITFQSPELRTPENTTISGLTSGASLVSYGQVGDSDLLCDFDDDLDIDTRDFALLGTYWKPANNTVGDVGPSTGSVPLLTPVPDDVVNYEDLFVFTRMWNWYHAADMSETSALAKGESELEWAIAEQEHSVRAALTVNQIYDLAMGHLKVSYNPAAVRMLSSSAGSLIAGEDNALAYFVEENGVSSVEVSFSRLPAVGQPANVSGTGNVMTIDFERIDAAQPLALTLEQVDLRTARNQQIYAKTAVNDHSAEAVAAPVRYRLSSYPNPFNSRMTVTLDLPDDRDVRLEIVNVLGQSVRTLADRHLTAGAHKIAWDGKDDSGEPVVTGMYFVLFKTKETQLWRKILYLK